MRLTVGPPQQLGDNRKDNTDASVALPEMVHIRPRPRDTVSTGDCG